jgi:hypothetical protein
MKKGYTLFLAVLVTAMGFAQSPQKMSYQAVIRNSSNVLVISSPVGMRVSILQGSVTGIEVYKERYNPIPQTNVNGLVTIEIGTGLPITGTFSGINWANGPYFIKVETDIAGGINYSVTGISELLSVPFALHAETVENVTGIVAIANGGTGAATVAGAKTSLGLSNVDNTTDLQKPVSTTTQTALNLKAPLASPAFNGTPLATTATAGTNTSQIATTAFVTSALAASVPAHYIGESYGGGIVFYVYDNGQHGLIAATADQSTGIRWYAGTYTNTMAFSDGVGAGKANTAVIIANQGYGDGATYAARICNEYSVTAGGVTYSDWYLPSKYELNLLYLQKAVVGGFTDNFYWSSSEIIYSYVWNQGFNSGVQYNDYKYNPLRVRAIRAF